MKLHIEDITSNAKGGWSSVSIYPTYNKWTSPLIDYPDEWFCVMDGAKPCLGKKHGYLSLTRLGFQSFEPDLKAVFLSNTNQMATYGTHNTWDEYKDAIEKHFVDVEKERQKLIKKHQKLIDELNNFKV
jgi:hypothetical protein